jgi:hypothetical protein
MTRAANLIADLVRKYLIKNYRLEEGHLVVEYGPMPNLTYRRVVVQYSQEERDLAQPYPGMSAFLNDRKKRDLHFGSNHET